MDMGATARDAFQAARNAGMLIIAASGNDGTVNHEAPLNYPAAYPSVLAVGAVDSRAEVATFSNGGEGLSLVAPGVDVLSTISLQGNTISKRAPSTTPRARSSSRPRASSPESWSTAATARPWDARVARATASWPTCGWSRASWCPASRAT
jgi:subtilisin family serine protease